MNQEIHEPTIEVTPHVGVGNIRLGASDSSVRQTLADDGLVFSESHDPYRWELKHPLCTLSFVQDPSKRLVQISCSSEFSRVNGHAIVGMRLDEAFKVLGIQRFDDTVWSVGEVEIDFESGDPYIDSDQRGKCPSEVLLRSGTLWIKSLALGLSLHAAEIVSVVVRESRYVPKIGYGQLDKQTLDAASDPATRVSLLESDGRALNINKSDRSLFRAILGCTTVVTAAVLGWVIYTMVQDYVSWMNATAVVGTVVDAKPEGLFPDELVVEYYMPDEKRALANIPSQYTTVHEIGQEVELVYREENPSVAMTKLQSRDHFSSISMNWLIYTIPLFSLELGILFPKYFRRRKR